MNKSRGCDFSGKKADLEWHEKKCDHRLITCPDIGCSESVELNFMMTHLKMSRGGRVVKDLTMRSGCADTFTFVEPEPKTGEYMYIQQPFNGILLKYMSTNFILNLNKDGDTHYAWLTHIGDSVLTAKFKVKMTLGKNQPTTMSHCGKVFPITTGMKEVMQDTSGLLVIGQEPFKSLFTEENGRLNYRIFVEFLHPVIKEEREQLETNVDETSLPNQLTYDYENHLIMHRDEVVKMPCKVCGNEIPISDFKQHVKGHVPKSASIATAGGEKEKGVTEKSSASKATAENGVTEKSSTSGDTQQTE